MVVSKRKSPKYELGTEVFEIKQEQKLKYIRSDQSEAGNCETEN